MYDIIFIGGGLNYAGAVVAAKKGLKIALIEKDLEHIGGTCLNNGCIPSKHLLELAKTEIELKKEPFKTHKSTLKLDIAVKEKDEVIKKAHKSISMQCLNAGVDLIEGEGFIKEPFKVEVKNRVYEGKFIVIGTGSTPFIPKGILYDKETIITSDEVLNLKDFPKNIAIYGSGAIGLEMASFFSACKIETTLIYRHSNISNKIHPQILEKLENLLKDIGINLLPNTSILEAKEHEKRAKVTTQKEVLEFDKLLVATGRVPNIDVIKTNMIKTDKAIITDDFFETTLQNHFAIGDCNGKLMLAHAARAEVLNVVENILGNKKRLNLSNIPKFFFSLPLQYASIGLTKYDLEKANLEYKESIFPLSALALSQFSYAKDGLVVVYADKEDFIIGAEILSPNAQELISIFSTSLALEADKKTMLEAIFPHPTFSEAIDRAIRRI